MYLCFCYYFEQAHFFFMFSGLLVFLFVKLLYYTTYFFNSNCTYFFVVLPNLQVGKLKLSNPIDVRLMPCLVEWMIS